VCTAPYKEVVLSEIVDAIIKWPAQLTESNSVLTVSNGFSTEKWDLDFLDYLSPARLKKLSESPRHYWWKYIEGNVDPDTPSKKLGRLLHWALLEPAEFKRLYVIEPTFSGKGSVAAKKEWHAKQGEDALIMNEKQATLIVNMIDAIQSNPESKKLLSNGTPEVRTFAKDDKYLGNDGLPVQWYSIMDFYRSGNVIVEVKSTRNPRLFSFEKDCLSFGYHTQTWVNRRSVQLITGQVPEVFIVAVENVPPHCVCVYLCPEHWFETAETYVARSLIRYNKGLKTGIWPGYQEQSEELSLPAYSELKYEEYNDFTEGLDNGL
jgi:hypothetical protein